MYLEESVLGSWTACNNTRPPHITYRIKKGPNELMPIFSISGDQLSGSRTPIPIPLPPKNVLYTCQNTKPDARAEVWAA